MNPFFCIFISAASWHSARHIVGPHHITAEKMSFWDKSEVLEVCFLWSAYHLKMIISMVFVFTISEISWSKHWSTGFTLKMKRSGHTRLEFPHNRELMLSSGCPLWAACPLCSLPQSLPFPHYFCLTPCILHSFVKPTSPFFGILHIWFHETKILVYFVLPFPAQVLEWFSFIQLLLWPCLTPPSLFQKGKRGRREMLLLADEKGAKGKICLLLAYQVLALVRGRI